MVRPEGEVLTEKLRMEMLSEGHNSQEFLPNNAVLCFCFRKKAASICNDLLLALIINLWEDSPHTTVAGIDLCQGWKVL